MWNGMGWNGMGWMGLWGLLVLVGIVLLVVLVVWVLVGGVGSSGRRNAPRSAARQRLDERYAGGELTTEEYRERVRALEED
jgi:putative membrane protein